MRDSRKHLAVYLLLALAWPIMVAWLFFEHGRIKNQAHTALLNRARDISNTVAVLSRSGGFNVIRQSRLEEALRDLTSSGELKSVVLLNSEGDVVASAGQPLHLKIPNLPQQVLWDADQVMVINLVNFGRTAENSGTTTAPLAIVIPSQEENTTSSRRYFPFRRPQSDRDMTSGTVDTTTSLAGRTAVERDRQTSFSQRGEGARSQRRNRDRRDIFRRPPWMTPVEYEAMLREQGLHGFVLVLSTAAMSDDIRRDLWLRIILATIALMAVGGLSIAWRAMLHSTRLQIGLLRAQEVNTHLREMNLAAAGLAHETRNPLNIVRGQTQMIAQSGELSEEIRDRAHRIMDEVDRVTDRLNEFINYSRPLEPRPAPTKLSDIIHDVIRTLETDSADQAIKVELSGPNLTVQADQLLLRQVLFNLLLNAIQAVPRGGRIQIAIQQTDPHQASIAIEDNGAGIDDSLREEIFRPYFTTNAQGTGLGLAIVKQIALAHRWEIDYFKNQWGGATFRLTALTIV